MLTKSLWHCHRVTPIDDLSILGDQYLAIVPEDNCIISIFPISRYSDSRIRIVATSIWYEEISEHELIISLITRRDSRWKKAYYREQGDFLQWFEPREPKDFNMFCHKMPWNFLTDDYLAQFEQTLARVNKIRNNSNFIPAQLNPARSTPTCSLQSHGTRTI
jgi:hypothetical protein